MNDSNHVLMTPMAYGEDRPEAEDPVKIMDVSLRDGQQALFSAQGRTEDMIPVAEKMDDIGFWAVEMWGGATFDVTHRILNEDPWERIKTLKQHIKQTPLSMVLRAQNLVGDRPFPDDVTRAFVETAANHGIDIFRTFDALNDFQNFEVVFEAISSLGKHFQGCICYSLTEPRLGGDVYSLDYYVEKAKALEKMGVDSICVRDVAGLMAPYDGYTLIKEIKAATTVPIHLHSHFTSGLASMTQLKAIEAGIDMVDTCLSPYAYRNSHPAVEPLVMSLLGTSRDTGFDLAKLAAISSLLEKDILPKYRHLLEDEQLSIIDTDVLSHQIPKPMKDTIIGLLEAMDASDKIEEVYQELAKVREDFGQIPLDTPSYQIIGTQAVNNVVFDDKQERYKMMTDQAKDLCYGLYGQTPAPIDPDVRKKALAGYPKGEKPLTGRPAKGLDPVLDEARKEVADLATGPEDEILYAMFPESGKQFLEWKYGKTDPPAASTPKTMDDARAEREMIARIKAGESIEGTGKTVPEKSEHLRTFNVFVGSDYFEVGVDEIGGPPEISYVRPRSAPRPMQSPAVAKPTPVKKADSSPAAPKPAPATPPPATPSTSVAVDGVALSAPMPGTIVAYEKNVGDTVNEGDTILVLEAMKMENALPSPASGVIKSIGFKEGDSVAKGDVLCVIG
ncbi:MAG: pyruvate carboxylase subunit B [Desulfobacterales bacterium]